MNVFEAVQLAARHLASAEVRFALVGGLAVSVRAEPRFTKDADVAIAVASDSEAEAAVRGLLLLGYRLLADLEQEATGRLATVRLFTPDEDREGPIVDLLFASLGIEPEVVQAATLEEIAAGGMRLPIARTGHLIAMKVLSERETRFQDSADLIALIKAAPPAELELARAAIDLMIARGASRGKDLQGTLDRYIALAAQA